MVVRITHPFHPCRGQQFELVSRGRHWGDDRVVYRAADGVLRTIATALTDIEGPDAFRRIAAGRAAFRTVDLLRLLGVLEQFARVMGRDNA